MTPTAPAVAATDVVPAPAPPPPVSEPGAADPLPPLKPRPRLLVAISVVFALWVVGLAVMYATTVYPERHPGKPVVDPATTRR